MINRLTVSARHMLASYIRAAVAIVGATQGFNVFDARGWAGLAQSLAVAAGPPLLVFLVALADALDGTKASPG